MSQYPWIYEPPGAGYPPGGDPLQHLLTPAKRAGILSIILGALMLACGVCIGAVGFTPIERFPPELRSALEEQQAAIAGAAEMNIQTIFVAGAVLITAAAIAMIVLGILVRGGRTGWIVSLLVLTGLMILVMLWDTVGGLLRSGDPRAAVGACVMAVPLGLMVLLAAWLIMALRNAGQIRAMRYQSQSNMWQFEQNRQAYQPYGYGPPPPPPPPPPQDPQQ